MGLELIAKDYQIKYYKLVIFKFPLSNLYTYFSTSNIKIGTIVSILFNKRKAKGLILEETEKPTFKLLEILSISKYYLSKTQIEVATFISKYYFSSLGQSISIFIPFQEYEVNLKKREKENKENKKLILSKIQKKAYNNIILKDKSLLFGVTGSGKTEIFITLIKDMIKNNKKSIFLMPEISITVQMEDRLKSYFGDKVSIWHSKISKKKKNLILERINNNQVDIIAGARSALFLPLKNVGLIIVDEEHDSSYKSEKKPKYHTRDMAIYIANKIGAKVLLASATPSISSYYKYDVIRLNEAYRKRDKEFDFINSSSINDYILGSLKSNFKKNNQSLVFIPNRANFKYIYCSQCGDIHKCPFCSIGLSLHRYKNYLQCHYCNYTERIIETCTSCGHSPLKNDRMGTAEAKDIIENSIENIKIEQLDSDTITTLKKLKDSLKRFKNGESHLLLGTKMITSGHDYPNITLSVILGLDYFLNMADYRAREKTLMLAIQISGRAGRNKKSKIIIQSNNIEFFESYITNYESFIQDELIFLKSAEYPPFSSLAKIIIQNKKLETANKAMLNIVKILEKGKLISIIGYGKAPIEKIKNIYIYNILVKSRNRIALLNILNEVNNQHILIDMDPI